MQFVFLNPVGSIGGAERVLIDVVSAIIHSMHGHAVTVILLADGPLVAALQAVGANVIVEPLPRELSGLGDSQLIGGHRLRKRLALVGHLAFGSLSFISFIYRLRRVILQQKPDVLYSNGLKTHLLSAIIKPRRAKLVWHLHDFYGARPAVAKVLGMAARRVDRGIAISQAIETDMNRLAPGLSIAVIYNSVDNVKFTPPGPGVNGAELDRLAGLGIAPDSVLRVGLIATYAYWKGHRTFIDAFAKARIRVSAPMRGYLIGGPIYSTEGSQFTADELKTHIRELGLEIVVGLIPFQSDTSSIYQMLDVVVHASTRPEPFGLTIVEAMSCGRAVIVSAAGGAKELFDEGVDGLGHTPGDSSQLAEAMVRLGNDADLRQRLATTARQTSCQRFSGERFRQELACLIDRL